MKKAVAIGSIVLLAGAFLYACGIIPNRDTSFVTITIGGRPQQAVLKAEAATPWLRMKHVLAKVSLVPAAEAYIPSVVQAIVVTVTADDIGTPIVGVANVAATDTSAKVTIEVPNGAGRTFLVEGYRGLPDGTTQLFYSGTATADLSGGNVTLGVDMSLVGPGILVDTLHSQATDTIGCGTAAMPCKTIAFALSRTTGTDAILVSGGTYTLSDAAAASTLLLQPGTALICTGPDFSTVIDASATNSDLIYGAEGASVDNCKLIPGSDTTGISDQGWRIKVNGVLIDADQTVGGALDGIILMADSLVLETTVLNTTWHGITVYGGYPQIRDSIVAQNPIGIEISSEVGDAFVTGCTISGNTMTGVNIASMGASVLERSSITYNATGVEINTSGTPTVQNNTITDNATGIVVNFGSPVIRSNAIRSNFTGITVADGYPEIVSNSIDHNSAYGVNISTSTGNAKANFNDIFCNSVFDVYIPSAFVAIDLQENAWDHDSTTNPPGPLVSNTGGGLSSLDIVYSMGTPTPLFTIIRPAVPNGCVPIPVQ